MGSHKDFWKEPAEHSKVKARIVSKYFAGWSTIMLNAGCRTLTYLDLFAGRGEYENGEPATAKMVLDVIGDPKKIAGLRSRLSLKFNEKDAGIFRELQRVVKDHPATKSLANPPLLTSEEVGRNYRANLAPEECTFTFIDPWGYRGITLDLLMDVIGNWGSDCLFYLSIEGIERNAGGTKQIEDLRKIFGESGVKAIRKSRRGGNRSVPLYEVVLSELRRAVFDRQPTAYLLPFAVEYENRRRVSHCLIFLSKHPRGFHVMKDIMARESFFDSEGFPEYFYRGGSQLELPFESRLRDTADQMLKDFAGKELSVRNVIDDCDKLRYLYPEKNLKQAFRFLEDEGKIEVDVPRDKRRTHEGLPTLGLDRKVRFLPAAR